MGLQERHFQIRVNEVLLLFSFRRSPRERPPGPF
jgi:hypothetical protein